MLSSAIEFNLLTVVTPSGRHGVGPSRRLAVAPSGRRAFDKKILTYLCHNLDLKD